MSIPVMIRAMLGGFAAVVALAQMSRAQAPEAGKNYDAYRLVQTRHIFDANRRASRVESSRDTRREERSTSRSSYLALTGTMVTDSKALAFFSGSSSENTRVVNVGDSVAGCRVNAISMQDVELVRDGKPVVLAIGNRLSLEGGGIEAHTATDPAPAATIAAGETTPTSADATAATPAGDPPSSDKSEVLRRMLERRQQEMSK